MRLRHTLERSGERIGWSDRHERRLAIRRDRQLSEIFIVNERAQGLERDDSLWLSGVVDDGKHSLFGLRSLPEDAR